MSTEQQRAKMDNKDFDAPGLLLNKLSKCINAVQAAHNIGEGSEDDSDRGAEKQVLASRRSKLLKTTQTIIDHPRPSSADQLGNAERRALRDLYAGIKSVRKSKGSGTELEAQFQKLRGASHELRAPSDVEPRDLDTRTKSWDLMDTGDAYEDFDIPMPDITEENFLRNRLEHA